MFISIVAGLYSVIYIHELIENEKQLSGNAQIDAIPYIDPVKLAVSQKLEGAKGLFQTSLLIIGVLWGLVITKKDDKSLLSDVPEVVMFAIANCLFCLSIYCYSEYTNAMATVLAFPGIQYDEPKDQTIMDFRDSRIDNLYLWQSRVFILAMIVTALSLISAHSLKKPKEHNLCTPSPV